MNNTIVLFLAWMAGGALGALFFGGLWWTVLKGASSARPALWFLGSFLLRIAVCLAGFYYVSGGHVGRLLLCLLGFAMARLAVTWRTGSSSERRDRPAREVSHAP